MNYWRFSRCTYQSTCWKLMRGAGWGARPWLVENDTLQLQSRVMTPSRTSTNTPVSVLQNTAINITKYPTGGRWDFTRDTILSIGSGSHISASARARIHSTG